MSEEKFSATFETITPIFTGDAWMEGKDIKKSSILGGLRFWFEVFLLNNEKYKNLLEEKIIKIENPRDKKKPIFEGNIVDFIFGTNGWKGLVEIEILNKNYGPEFDRIVLNDKWYFKKYKNGNYIKNEDGSNKKIIPKWYIDGINTYNFKFQIKISKRFFQKVNGINNLESIIYEYFDFLDLYGFVGGKSELGFGKIVRNNNGNQQKYNFLNDRKELFDLNNSNIKVFDLQKNNNFDKSGIEEYLTWKVDERLNYKSMNTTKNDISKRHYVFGSTVKDTLEINLKEIKGPNGSKLLPVFRNGKIYVLSVTMIQNLPNNSNNNDN